MRLDKARHGRLRFFELAASTLQRRFNQKAVRIAGGSHQTFKPTDVGTAFDLPRNVWPRIVKSRPTGRCLHYERYGSLAQLSSGRSELGADPFDGITLGPQAVASRNKQLASLSKHRFSLLPICEAAWNGAGTRRHIAHAFRNDRKFRRLESGSPHGLIANGKKASNDNETTQMVAGTSS